MLIRGVIVMTSRRSVTIGDITIGGGAPIRVESMLKTRLDDPGACVAQLEALKAAGCELVRIAYPDLEHSDQLREVVRRSPLPIMADIHFNHKFALSAIDCGCRSIRINPGNMSGSAGLDEVVRAARDNSVVIRIGANGGSLSNEQVKSANGDRAVALEAAVEEQLRALTDLGFEQVIVSAKSSSVPETVRANSMLASRIDLPFHIGITEAGPGVSGTVKGSVGIGMMLSQGIGDTVRVSLTGDPVGEVEVAYDILRSLELRMRGVDLISCPGCGRRRVDIFSLVERVKKMLPPDIPDGTSVAVMGCEVNGPREASHADVGVAGTSNGFVIFKKGEAVASGTPDELETALAKMFQR